MSERPTKEQREVAAKSIREGGIAAEELVIEEVIGEGPILEEAALEEAEGGGPVAEAVKEFNEKV